MTEQNPAKRAPVFFIFVTVVLDAMGIGLIMPIMPSLIKEVDGVTLAEAALWGGILSATFAAMQFLFSPLLGNLSDRYGRRPVLLISLAIMAIDYVVMAIAGTIWLLLFGRVIGGITAATHSTAAAYMADISPPEKKSQNFGLISAAFGVGFVLGPALGGLLAEFGTRAPFFAAGVMAALNFAFGYFVLPESVKPENRRPFQWRRANPLGGLKYIGQLPGVGILLFVWFFFQVANWVYPAVWAYFTQAAFGWEERMVGISLTVYGISIAIVQGLLIRWVIARFGERRTVWVGILFNAIVLSMIAFVTSGWLMLCLIPLSALGAIVTPALQGVMSRRASDDQQGELQGVLSSINAIATIIAPLAMTQIFYAYASEGADPFLPGAPFLAAAALMFVAWVLYAGSVKPRHRANADAQ